MTDPRRTLFLDIETKPSIVYTFQFWNVNISPDKIIEPGGLLCFAYSWGGEDETHFVKGEHDDMAVEAYALLDEADVVVTYNGDKFDLPHLDRAFTLAGLESPSPFTSVDLFKVLKREQRGAWPSLRLGYIAQQLELSEKYVNSGFSLWTRCMEGDEEAWAEMEKYNVDDIGPLKDGFELLRHKIKNLPAASLFTASDEEVCPNCASTNFQRRGTQYNKTRSYQRFYCNDCHDWFRGNVSINSATATTV